MWKQRIIIITYFCYFFIVPILCFLARHPNGLHNLFLSHRNTVGVEALFSHYCTKGAFCM